jgi:hypothetical protein
MKNIWMSIFTFALLIGFGTFFTSCDKDDDTDPQTTEISDDEIIAIVSGATVDGTEGITAETTEMAYVADDALDEQSSAFMECGETMDSTFVQTIDHVRISGEYNTYLYWALNCNNNIPNSITFGHEVSGNYESDRLISDDSADSDWTITNLLTGANYIFNGTYERTGTQESTVREMRSFDTTVSITVQDLNMDKGEKEIVSGIANFTLSGTINDETTFTQSGTIVFLGDGAANIIINGNTYTIDLY